MRAAVSDTSPLRYLILIDAIEILPLLFEGVFVPDVVHAELRHAHAPAAVRRWAEALPSWLTVAPTQSVQDADLLTLDAGERAAIALAMAIRPDFLLIDERAGVAAARARGLEVTGTLGLLQRAAQRGLTDLPTAFAALKATNFHVRQELLDALLARHDGGNPGRA
jgi:predicted nucleic acid-binding protein